MKRPEDHVIARSGGRERSALYGTGVWRIVVATLREIFDESAYARFLERTGSERSAVSYRAFLKDREALVMRKPRCC